MKAAMPLCFPEAVLNQHLVMLGKTGSGKSSKLRHIVEHLLARRKRVCIIDPKGDWWGLKVDADGKGPGFPVIMLGDFKEPKAADVRINATSGKHVAELIATGNRPCVIGFRGWRTSDMLRFWIDFAQTLFAMNAGELYVVGDEFHNFAPKGKVLSPQAGESLHWSNRLLSEGRGLGLTCLIASQRPQKVHNDVLTSCETLAAMRVIHAADRAAIKDWLDGAGDAKLAGKVLDDLASLPREQAFVWSPEIGFGPERVTFPFFTTFDSFAPPQVQKKVTDKGWADVNLDEVKAKLAAVIEEKKANDPAVLKKENAELRKQLAQASAAKPQREQVVEKKVEVPVVTDTQLDRITAMHDRADKRIAAFIDRCGDAARPILNELNEQKAKLGELLAAVLTHRPYRMQLVHPTRGQNPVSVPATAGAPMGHTTKPVAPVVGGRTVASSHERTSVPQRILNAIGWWKAIGVDHPDRLQVAVMADYHPNAKSFVNSLGSLRSGGLVDGYSLTEAGRDQAVVQEHLPTLAQHQERILSTLVGVQRDLLQKVIDAGGLARDELAAALGYHPNAKSFVNSLGRIRTLGFVNYEKGRVVATALVFPKGLT